jgi:hypothetical protein
MTKLQALFVAALSIVATCPRVGHAHVLDEYLQATRLAISRERIVLEIDLTAGAAVAAGVFTQIDRDGDGQVSPSEIETYGQNVLQDLVIELDARPYALRLTRAECPSWPEIRDGDGTIRLEAVADVVFSSGRHRLRYANAHQPAIGTYMVNALVPSTRAIAITAQQRDIRQRRLDLDIDVAAPSSPVQWSLVSGVGFAALILYRRRDRSRALSNALDSAPDPGRSRT